MCPRSHSKPTADWSLSGIGAFWTIMGDFPVISATPGTLEGLGYCLVHSKCVHDYEFAKYLLLNVLIPLHSQTFPQLY